LNGFTNSKSHEFNLSIRVDQRDPCLSSGKVLISAIPGSPDRAGFARAGVGFRAITAISAIRSPDLPITRSPDHRITGFSRII
jgi:hypothetical protein